MAASTAQQRSKFPALYWLVVVFEFFERGSYYGVMSVLSVYLVDELQFAKQDVGLIKGTIQPLLYFLPILSGALADRFGYRRMLMIAFAFLGGGYFLVSQSTQYAAVFGALVVMGLGAGTFKPIISGSIARCTDETNSTLGFGIFYWSINLGAFLVPLFLVPVLRQKVGLSSVLIAAAIGTGILLVPTILFFREPPKPKEKETPGKKKANLLQTLADAFEIIYSPIVLLAGWMRRSPLGVGAAVVLVLFLLGYGGWQFVTPAGNTSVFSARGYDLGGVRLVVHGKPNLCSAKPFKLEADAAARRVTLKLFDPDKLAEHAPQVLAALGEIAFLATPTLEELTRYRDEAVKKTILDIDFGAAPEQGYGLVDKGRGRVGLQISSWETYERQRGSILEMLRQDPRTSALGQEEVDDLASKADKHPFLLFFVGLLLLTGLIVQRAAGAFQQGSLGRKLTLMAAVVGTLYLIVWLLPGLSLFARILTSVLSLTVVSLFAIDYRDMTRFKDHFKFLAMIAIYSGFWVLYFQMFDSVLWYVQAYVDSSSANAVFAPIMNGIYSTLGVEIDWHFDVEFVTVINAFTIILLQLVVSALVKNTKALPTMIVGIILGTIGMAILAISTYVWVFIAGIVIFSIGEMTAHPKFISYIGQTAPKSRVAMYMGYLFLYGVIGASIGGVLGANLYVTFVDELNQPRTLWLIFAGIGVATVIGLLLYNSLVVGRAKQPAQPDDPGAAAPGQADD
jgi:dipeptide/tripeptide permease